MLDEIGIAPSILSADLMDLGHEVKTVAGARYIHFDVMDGSFVPEISYGHPVLRALKKTTDIPVDVHLMISNPDEEVASYLEAGADMVSFHVECAKHAQRIVDEIHAAGKLAGIALNPGTSAYTLDALLPAVDMVLVMSVNPGFGGQKFIPETPEKIRTILRLAEAHGAHPLIEVDGGISRETAGLVASAGARLLVAGSAVFKAEDRHKAMAEIVQAAQAGLGRKA